MQHASCIRLLVIRSTKQNMIIQKIHLHKSYSAFNVQSYKHRSEVIMKTGRRSDSFRFYHRSELPPLYILDYDRTSFRTNTFFMA